MKNCPKCNKEHSLNGVFCCRSCANSRIFSEESKKKKSEALKGKPTKRNNYDKVAQAKKSSNTWLLKYQNTSFEQLGMVNRRRRVFEEQNFCCNNCKISEWLNIPIILELEHKDGNTHNNDRNNLEGLCPNCHSLTETWRGRNKYARIGLVDVTDEYLLQCLTSSETIRQGLLKAGIAAKGNNYVRAKKLLENLGSKH